MCCCCAKWALPFWGRSTLHMHCQPAQASGMGARLHLPRQRCMMAHACSAPRPAMCRVIKLRRPGVAQGQQRHECLQARHVILIAFGEGKAAAVAQAVEGPVTDQVGCTASHCLHSAEELGPKSACGS